MILKLYEFFLLYNYFVLELGFSAIINNKKKLLIDSFYRAEA